MPAPTEGIEYYIRQYHYIRYNRRRAKDRKHNNWNNYEF